MKVDNSRIRVLAVASGEMRSSIVRQLSPLDAELVFLHTISEVPRSVLEQGPFEVALIPFALPDLEWWALWGRLRTLERRPAILVYTRAPTFQLWTSVLDMGGYDVIVEPFLDDEIQTSVLHAAQSFVDASDNDP